MKAIRLGSNVSYEDGLKHQDEAVAASLAELQQRASLLKVLGSYPLAVI